jgi:DNA ligase-1
VIESSSEEGDESEKAASEPKAKKVDKKEKKPNSPKPTAKKQTVKKSPPEKEVKTEQIEEVKEIEKEKSPVKKETVVEAVKVEKKEAPAKNNNVCSLFNSMKQKSTANSLADANSLYLPDKPNFHPVNDAFWEKGQPVPYKALAQTLYCMEKTTKRLELLSIVTNFFRSILALTPKDLVPALYLLTNKVAPDYENIELGIGDTVLFKALAEATGSTLAKLKTEFQSKGDIGLVAEANRCNQKLIVTPKKLSIAGVHLKLKEVAQISGNSSQNKKCDMIRCLLVSCDSIEARYLMRSLAGKLRNGLGEQSILNSLAHACSITPPILNPETDKLIIDKFEKMRKADQTDEIKKLLEKSAQMVKNAYYQCPNYDQVVNAILKHGLNELEQHCKLTPGVPLRPMLAYPTKGVQEVLKRFENVQFTCEYKYDGERAQIHILDDGSIQIYSRNLENNTSKYPDVIEFLQTQFNLKKKEERAKMERPILSAIIDAEVVAYDIEKHIIQPFQKLSTRKRKVSILNICPFFWPAQNGVNLDFTNPEPF